MPKIRNLALEQGKANDHNDEKNNLDKIIRPAKEEDLSEIGLDDIKSNQIALKKTIKKPTASSQ